MLVQALKRAILPLEYAKQHPKAIGRICTGPIAVEAELLCLIHHLLAHAQASDSIRYICHG